MPTETKPAETLKERTALCKQIYDAAMAVFVSDLQTRDSVLDGPLAIVPKRSITTDQPDGTRAVGDVPLEDALAKWMLVDPQGAAEEFTRTKGNRTWATQIAAVVRQHPDVARQVSDGGGDVLLSALDQAVQMERPAATAHVIGG